MTENNINEIDLEDLDEKLDYYLSLPYTIKVIRDVDEGEESWFAKVVELPGCMTEADTFTELGEMIKDAMRAWIEIALEDGHPVPEPRPTESYSGKFVVRLPKSLHRELAEAAERDGVSLNAFVNVALARSTSQHYSLPGETESNKTPAPFWPQLSKDAWRAMVAAKLEVEAHAVNEQMFADWLDNNIQQIEAAIEIGAMKDAHQYLLESRQALKICQDNSPIMKVFHRTIKMLEQNVIETHDGLNGPDDALSSLRVLLDEAEDRDKTLDQVEYLGNLFYNEKQFEIAKKIFEQILIFDPDRVNTKNLLNSLPKETKK